MNETKKRKIITLVLCFFFGMYGVHKFYQKKIGLGILYLFTAGIFGFGWLVDTITLLIDLINFEKAQPSYTGQSSYAQASQTKQPSYTEQYSNIDSTPCSEQFANPKTDNKPNKHSRKKALICAFAGIPIVFIVLCVIIGSMGDSNSESSPAAQASTVATPFQAITTEAATPTTEKRSLTTTKATTAKQTKTTEAAASTLAPKSVVAGGSSSSTAKPKTTAITTRKTTVKRTDPPKTTATKSSKTKYVVNTSTGIFHCSDCHHVKRMDEINKQEVNTTSEELKAQGYKPCKTCNP